MVPGERSSGFFAPLWGIFVVVKLFALSFGFYIYICIKRELDRDIHRKPFIGCELRHAHGPMQDVPPMLLTGKVNFQLLQKNTHNEQTVTVEEN